MRKLWDFWKNKKYGKKSMTGWFLLTNALLCGGIGAALWGVVSLVALKGISWHSDPHAHRSDTNYPDHKYAEAKTAQPHRRARCEH